MLLIILDWTASVLYTVNPLMRGWNCPRPNPNFLTFFRIFQIKQKHTNKPYASSNHRHEIRFQGILYLTQWLFVRHLYSNLRLLSVWELIDFIECLLKRERKHTGYNFWNELKLLKEHKLRRIDWRKFVFQCKSNQIEKFVSSKLRFKIRRRFVTWFGMRKHSKHSSFVKLHVNVSEQTFYKNKVSI